MAKQTEYTKLFLALNILKDGHRHETEAFLHLYPRYLPQHHEYWQRQRTVKLLVWLSEIMDGIRSEYILLQLAKKGQAGIYQLRKRRDMFGKIHPDGVVIQPGEYDRRET